MEVLLNVAWILCSLGLVGFWLRVDAATPKGRNRISRRTQIFALGVVLLLLLPVISLSDDLVAAQGPTETDSSLRRSIHIDDGHPSVVPAVLSFTDEILSGLSLSGSSQDFLESEGLITPPSFVTPTVASRPPPARG